MRTTRAITAVLASTALLAAACGSVEDPGPTGAAADEGETTASGPITVTDARGEELTLDAPAEEVVGLEWGVVENLVSVGVTPVGVADVAGYEAWVGAAPLDGDVTDVGTRGEPSVDAIAGLAPDLVITTTDLPANVIEQLEEIVPVLVVRGAAADRPIEQMRDNLTVTAEVVGRSDDAEDLLAELDAAIAEGAEAVDAAGLAGAPFTMSDGYLQGSTLSIRMFTDGSLVGAVGEELGLENVWEGEGDPDYGLAQTDVEGLTALPDDVHFLYYANDAVEGDPFEEALTGNAIWEDLAFVQDDRVHRLPDGIWMFGGPRSLQQWIDAVVAALTA